MDQNNKKPSLKCLSKGRTLNIVTLQSHSQDRKDPKTYGIFNKADSSQPEMLKSKYFVLF